MSKTVKANSKYPKPKNLRKSRKIQRGSLMGPTSDILSDIRIIKSVLNNTSNANFVKDVLNTMMPEKDTEAYFKHPELYNNI